MAVLPQNSDVILGKNGGGYKVQRRRGHDEGTIFKREGRLRVDGTRGPARFVGQLRFDGPDGDRKRSTFYGATQRDVRKKLEAAKLARHQGQLASSAHQTVAQCLWTYLAMKREGIRTSTFSSYEQVVRKLCVYLGEIRLDQLRDTHVRHCYSKMLQDGVSARTVQKTISVLRPALQCAVQEGLIRSNPCSTAPAPRVTKKEMQVLSREQVHTLLYVSANDTLGPLYVVLVSTGLRIGEALALRWADVDLSEKTLMVRRTVQRIRGHGLVVGEPKSATSRRTVYLVDVAVAALHDQHARQEEQRQVLGPEWQENDLVFHSIKGTHLDPTNVHHRFEKALQAAGLPRVRVHDLRHTAATLALEQGVHPKIVQEMLGHQTYVITMDLYSHHMPSLHREAIQAMNEVFNESPDCGWPGRGRETLKTRGKSDPGHGV